MKLNTGSGLGELCNNEANQRLLSQSLCQEFLDRGDEGALIRVTRQPEINDKQRTERHDDKRIENRPKADI